MPQQVKYYKSPLCLSNKPSTMAQAKTTETKPETKTEADETHWNAKEVLVTFNPAFMANPFGYSTQIPSPELPPECTGLSRPKHGEGEGQAQT